VVAVGAPRESELSGLNFALLVSLAQKKWYYSEQCLVRALKMSDPQLPTAIKVLFVRHLIIANRHRHQPRFVVAVRERLDRNLSGQLNLLKDVGEGAMEVYGQHLQSKL